MALHNGWSSFRFAIRFCQVHFADPDVSKTRVIVVVLQDDDIIAVWLVDGKFLVRCGSNNCPVPSTLPRGCAGTEDPPCRPNIFDSHAEL